MKSLGFLGGLKYSQRHFLLWPLRTQQSYESSVTQSAVGFPLEKTDHERKKLGHGRVIEAKRGSTRQVMWPPEKHQSFRADRTLLRLDNLSPFLMGMIENSLLIKDC